MGPTAGQAQLPQVITRRHAADARLRLRGRRHPLRVTGPWREALVRRRARREHDPHPVSLIRDATERVSLAIESDLDGNRRRVDADSHASSYTSIPTLLRPRAKYAVRHVASCTSAGATSLTFSRRTAAGLRSRTPRRLSGARTSVSGRDEDREERQGPHAPLMSPRRTDVFGARADQRGVPEGRSAPPRGAPRVGCDPARSDPAPKPGIQLRTVDDALTSRKHGA
jgi:hypothetical protein